MNKVVNLLQQYISEGQLEKALLECKKFVKANPNEIYPLKLLAHIYYLQEDYQPAIENTLKILEMKSEDFDGNNNIGSYYLKTEQFKFKKTNYACRTGFSLPFDYYINKIPIPLKHYSSSFLI